MTLVLVSQRATGRATDTTRQMKNEDRDGEQECFQWTAFLFLPGQETQ